jgi:hypothetical protein
MNENKEFGWRAPAKFLISIARLLRWKARESGIKKNS